MRFLYSLEHLYNTAAYIRGQQLIFPSFHISIPIHAITSVHRQIYAYITMCFFKPHGTRQHSNTFLFFEKNLLPRLLTLSPN